MKFVETLYQRGKAILGNYHVEFAEVVSLVFAGAWLLSLLLYPDFMASSVYLKPMGEHITRPLVIGVTGSLLAYQLIALFLGGSPSVAITGPVSERRWLKARALGVVVSNLVWAWFLVLQSLTGVVTPLGWMHLAGVVAIGLSFPRFAFLIKERTHYAALRQIHDTAVTGLSKKAA